jgi:hypothetical protein
MWSTSVPLSLLSRNRVQPGTSCLRDLGGNFAVAQRLGSIVQLALPRTQGAPPANIEQIDTVLLLAGASVYFYVLRAPKALQDSLAQPLKFRPVIGRRIFNWNR